MHRRDFLKNSCSLCILLGGGMVAESFESCSTLSTYSVSVKEHSVTVPLSILANNSLLIVQPEQYPYDIALRNNGDGSYESLLLRCTHAANPVKYDGDEFTCSLHGSKFNEQGNVVRGPASLPLQKLLHRLTEFGLVIDLPIEH